MSLSGRQKPEAVDGFDASEALYLDSVEVWNCYYCSHMKIRYCRSDGPGLK